MGGMKEEIPSEWWARRKAEHEAKEDVAMLVAIANTYAMMKLAELVKRRARLNG